MNLLAIMRSMGNLGSIVCPVLFHQNSVEPHFRYAKREVKGALVRETRLEPGAVGLPGGQAGAGRVLPVGIAGISGRAPASDQPEQARADLLLLAGGLAALIAELGYAEVRPAGFLDRQIPLHRADDEAGEQRQDQA